jgi:hypothetical protein
MRVIALPFGLDAVVHGEHIKRPSDRTRLQRVERILEAALKTTERMLRLCDFLSHYVRGQLVIFDEPHARRLSREGAA